MVWAMRHTVLISLVSCAYAAYALDLDRKEPLRLRADGAHAGPSDWLAGWGSSGSEGTAHLRSSLKYAWSEITHEFAAALDQPDESGPAPQGPAPQGPPMPAVSCTLQCVMTLTVVSMIVYTVLAVSRNVDELNGEPASIYTQAFNVASRSAVLMPMLCMLFVACRMYVLATTEGRGEPPDWVKGCMRVATGGLLLQLGVVLALPYVTVTKTAKPGDDGIPESPTGSPADDEPVPEPYDSVTGEMSDAHPVLQRAEFDEGMDTLAPVFWGAQVLSMVMVYGGVAGVIVGILTFPAQSTQISPAVINTIILSTIYFSVFLFLWISRTMKTDETQEVLMNIGLAASAVCRKMPMFAVLFLGARMRALNLDPPLGLPPKWMQACFFTVAGCLICETIAAAIAGATSTSRKAYYGINIFRSQSKTPQIAQHVFALISYAMLIPITVGVIIMKDMRPGADHEVNAPLSTTLHCILIYEFVYFGVMASQTITVLLEDIEYAELPMTLNTTLSAGVSLGLAPLFCILFVATRMRALQITEQLGAPPGWAQDCMYICVFGTCVQAVCCLVMPIFVGGAYKVDEDGNPDYDCKPMIGAYAVTVVKYVAMMSLYGSVATICVAVYVMDHESCMDWRNNRFITSYKSLFEALIFTSFIFLLALLFSSAKVIGMAVKMAIEAVDQEFLGVDITIQNAALSVCKGYVKIEKMKIHQPEFEVKYERKDGKLVGTKTEPPVQLQWKEDYIFKIKTLLVKINLWRLATTLGKEFELENLTLLGVHANVEKPNPSLRESNSNVEYIINFIDALGLIPPPDAAAAEPAPDLGDIPKIILRHIEVGDIGASVEIRKVPIIGAFSFKPRIGIIEFDDIQRDVFKEKDDLTPSETIAMIVRAIGEKIFKMIVKDIPEKLKQKTKEGVGAIFTEGPKKVAACMDGAKAAAQGAQCQNVQCFPEQPGGGTDWGSVCLPQRTPSSKEAPPDAGNVTQPEEDAPAASKRAPAENEADSLQGEREEPEAEAPTEVLEDSGPGPKDTSEAKPSGAASDARRDEAAPAGNA